MEFLYEYKANEFKGKVLYLTYDKSLTYEPSYARICDVIILMGCGYLGLDGMSDNRQILQISGCNPMKIWITSELNIPVAKKGNLFYDSETYIMRGSAVYYSETWRTFYDKNTNYICMCESLDNESDIYVEFANDLIAGLKGSKLVSIWAKIEIVPLKYYSFEVCTDTL